MKKNYRKNDLIVHWDSSLCMHSGNCVRNLKSVFNPKNKPWIDVEKGRKEEIIETINKCPSGALSFTIDKEVDEENEDDEKPAPEVSVTVVHNGPIRIRGSIRFVDMDGNETIRDGFISICRCSKTSDPPFCDGSHKNLVPKLDE